MYLILNINYPLEMIHAISHIFLSSKTLQIIFKHTKKKNKNFPNKFWEKILITVITEFKFLRVDIFL